MPDKLIQTALDQFAEAEEVSRSWRTAADEDIRFAGGDQWPEHLKAWREAQRLPTLTIDRLEGPISQLVGDQRQNDLAVKVVCKSLESKKLVTTNQRGMDESDFLAGVVRDIQRRSRFDWVQAQAFEHAVVCGLGGWYIDAEYESEDSFDQVLNIKRIPNPLAIYADWQNWASTQGMDYGFVLDHFTEDAFKARWPNASTAWDAADEWGGDLKRVAIWWQREWKPETLLQIRLADGRVTVLRKSELGTVSMPPGARLLKERETKLPSIKRRVCTSLEVLEEVDWVGKIIPLCLVTGKESWHKGKLDYIGMIRKAKDAQRLYNYNRSTVAEIMGGAVKAPYILTAEQVRGFEEMWATANVGNKPYLLVNPDPKAPGWPHRSQIEYPAGFANEAIVASADIMSVTKIHEASLGQRSNETSGVAIQQRQKEGDTGNYVFTDQLLLAIEETGRILVDAIPKVYDSTRLVTARARDGETSTVMLNDPKPGAVWNRLTGKYDVEVTSGPAFGTARQEAVQAMTALAQAAPQLLQVGADIWVGNMDWPGADELAKRLKKMVPPELLNEEEMQGDPAAMLGQMQQALQQAQAMLQQTQQAAQEAAQALQQSEMKAMSSQAEIERLKTDLNEAQAELNLTKQSAQLAIDTVEAKLKQVQDYHQAADALRGSVPQEQPEMPDLAPILKAVQDLGKSMQSKPEPTQPVQVIVETSDKPKIRRGRAVKQADGSWQMEAVEEEVGK